MEIHSLTREQIAFFKDQGYLILKGVLDPQLCASARDLLWNSLPDNVQIRRDDPATHVGPFPESDSQTDTTDSRTGYRWQVRKHSTDADLINLLYSETLMGCAEQLLGHDSVRQPVINGSVMGSKGPAWPGGPVDPALNSEGIRGIYATLPYPESETRGSPDAAAHTDGHPFMLSAVGLIHDCPPGGGAFTVWPGSHKRLYPTFWMQYDQARIPFYDHMPSLKGILHSPEYNAELKRILEDTKPVDCWGSAGDVVFWHHRLVHAASENHSSVIRQAVLADYSRRDLDQLRLDPPQEDMWRDWSPEVQNSGSDYSASFAQEQRIVA